MVQKNVTDALPTDARPTATTSQRILVVEDNMLQALSLAAMLEQAGYVAVGPAHDAREARELALAHPPDLALLDVNLGVADASGGETIAEVLLRLNVPFIFLSAYERSHLATQLQAFPHVRKPYQPAALLRVIAASLPAVAQG